MNTIAIPLERLRIGSVNMNAAARVNGLEALKASLLVHGQLQPLLVMRGADADGEAVYEVIAGRRRTLAARALVAEGRWPEGVRLAAVRRRVSAVEASELSLAENVLHEAPNPADEAAGFARLVADGADPAALAARFGRPVRYVVQRLAIAGLSPAVLEALRGERIGVGVAEALTLTASHARQEELLERVAALSAGEAARYVRGALRRSTLPVEVALPEALAAYEAAGGTVTRDLFDGEGTGLIDDPERFLACQRDALAREAERRRAAWAFVEVVSGPALWTWPRDYVPAEAADPPAADLDEDERAALEAERAAVAPVPDRSVCGVVATLEDDGRVTWHEGLRRRDPAVPALPVWGMEEEDPAADGVEDGVEDGGRDADGEDGRDGVVVELPTGPRLSAAVREELAAVRTASVQAGVMGSPYMALRLACFALLSPYGGPCALAGGEVRPPEGARAVLTSRARETVERARAAWAERLGSEGGRVYDADALWERLGDPGIDVSALFAFLVAVRCRLEHGSDGVGTAAARDLGVAVAADWRPDPAFLERLPKAMIREAARAIDPGFAEAIGGLRKAEMAERVGRCLEAAHDAGADWPALTGNRVSALRGNLESARAGAAAWLPPGTAVAGEEEIVPPLRPVPPAALAAA